MRHLNSGRQLRRNSSHRTAMMRNIVTSLFKHEQIETTDAKAKELRSVAEKIITLAKEGGSPCPTAGSGLPSRTRRSAQAL